MKNMSDASDDDDIVQKYLPIFLNLQRQAVEEARHSRGSRQTLSTSDQEPVASTSTSHQFLNENVEEAKPAAATSDSDLYQNFLRDDFPDSAFGQIPETIGETLGENATASVPEVEEFPPVVKFPNISHLHRKRMAAEKLARTKIPTLFIKDLLESSNWISSFGRKWLRCDDLFETDLVIFSIVKCRGTIVGFDLSKLLVYLDDGTGMMFCILDEEDCEEDANCKIDGPPIMASFVHPPTTYERITSLSSVNRGDVVQIQGNFRIYYNKRRIYIKRMYREGQTSITREVAYVNYVQRLYASYITWKLNF